MSEDRLPSLAIEQEIAWIRLNDPATYNGLSPAAFARLREIFEALADGEHPGVRAVILTASGKGFCAGAELNSVFRSVPEGVRPGPHIAQWTRDEGTPAMMALNRLPLPLVVAINGVTAGIGMSIALRGDVVLAARSASFVVPFFTRLGIVPDGGLSWQLPRLVGQARATAMCLLGEKLSAEEAVRSGLIWRCVDDEELERSALEVARKLARLPAYACREMRGLLAASLNHSYEQQYEHELRRNEELLDGPDFIEGLNAFFEKREPRFPT